MLRIAIVDDSELFTETLSGILRRFAHVEIVSKAASMEEGLFRIAESAPHLVFIDVNLPEPHGFLMAKHVKQLFPRLRTIVMSAECAPGYSRAALDAGAEGFVCKGDMVDYLPALLAQAA